MSQTTRKDYLVRMRVRYQRRTDRGQRRALLEEFCEVSGYERKYALKLLNGTRPGPARSPATRGKRGAVYGAAEHRVLHFLWKLTGKPCGKRLKVVVADFLPHYEKHEGRLDATVRARVLKISAAQIDRLLKGERPQQGARRPRPGSDVRSQVPLREGPATGSEPGWMQADTVWHCGGSTGGTFVCSLLLTCTWSHWTVVRATWNHSDRVIHGRIREIEEDLPFPILGCHTDNGGEFINATLIRYFREREVPVRQTRSRAYIKNDNALAEERNRRRVRDFLGYERMDDPRLTAAADALLVKWNLWSNLYMPTGKLSSKKRNGSKVIRKHEAPQTPCQRLLSSPRVSDEDKTALRALLAATDPITLRREIDRDRTQLEEWIKHPEKIPTESSVA